MPQDNRASPNVTPVGQGDGPENMRPVGQPDQDPLDRRDGPSPEVERAVTPKVIER